MSNREYYNATVDKKMQDVVKSIAEEQGYGIETDREGTLYVHTPRRTYIYRLEPSEVIA